MDSNYLMKKKNNDINLGRNFCFLKSIDQNSINDRITPGISVFSWCDHIATTVIQRTATIPTGL